MDMHLFEKLNSRVQQLLTLCHDLRMQNHALQRKHDEVLVQYNDLKEKNNLVRVQVENLVHHLNNIGVDDE